MSSPPQDRQTVSRPMQWAMRFVDVTLIAAGLAQVALFWPIYIKEDALISYRYALNLARGNGLVYNPGEYVEGISNLLWTLELALFHWMGLSLDTADDLLIFGHTALGLVVLRWVCLHAFGDTWAARLPLFLVVCMTAVQGSYGNGLEGSAVGAAVMLLLAGAVALRPRILTAGAVMLLLLRPEAFAYVGWAMFWLLVVSYRDPALRRKALACAFVTAGVFAALTAFRLAYYGDYIPNTVRAKGGNRLDSLILAGGMRYLAQYAWSIGPVTLLLALVAAAEKQRRALWLLAAGLVALNVATVCANGGDWMGNFRLLTPFFALIAFLAGMGTVAVRRHLPRLGIPLALAVLAAGAWTVLPRHIADMLTNVPNRVTMALNGTENSGLPFEPHVSLRDVGAPDDRWMVELGGQEGLALDGVRVSEMFGLTDREIACGTGPGTWHKAQTGRICWPAAFAKEPTYITFCDAELYRHISTVAATPGLAGVISRYMVVQDRPIGASRARFNLFLARCDRRPMAKFILWSGAVTPAADYVRPEFSTLPWGDNGPGTVPGTDAPLRTAWQKAGWTGGSGKQIPTGWVDWDDGLRLSSRLALERGTNRFTHMVMDDSPLVFILGRFPLFAPNLHARVIAVDKDGGEKVIAQSDLSEPASGEFILSPFAVSGWGGGRPVSMAVELEADAPCAVFLAAHRWTREPLPELPSRVVADTRNPGTTALRVPEMPDANAAAERWRDAFEADPDNLEKRFLFGAATARKGDWAAAEPHLRRVLSLDRGMWPVGVAVFAEEAERRHENGDLKGAADMLRMACAMDPLNLSYPLRLAEALTELGEFDEARTQCRRVLVQGPDSAELPRAADLMDCVYEQLGDAQGRVAEWRYLSECHPDCLPVTLNLARALDAVGDDQEALDAYRRVMDAQPEAAEASRIDAILAARNDAQGRVAEWRIMVDRHPEARAPRLYLAAALAAAGKIGPAADLYTAWLAEHPNDSVAQLGLADTWARGRNAASALADAGETGAAADEFRALLARVPNDGEAQLGLAWTLARGGDTPAALKVLDVMVPAKPGQNGNVADTLDRIAKELIKRSEMRPAIAVLFRSVAMDPDNLQHAALLAGLVEQLNDDDALEQWGRMVQILPEWPKAPERIDAIFSARDDSEGCVAMWRGLVECHPKARVPRLHLAAALADAGETGAAADILRTLLAEANDDSEARLGLVSALARGENAAAALEVLNGLTPVKPGQERSCAAQLDRIADIFAKRSETQTAAAVLRRAMALEPDNYKHAVLLAGVLEQLGDDDGALELYRTTVTARPESPKSSDRIDAILAARGDENGRVVAWRAIAEKNPAGVIPWQRLADALERAGDRDGARVAGDRATRNASEAGS